MSAEPVGSRTGDLHAEQHPPVADHGCPVVVPVRMLPRNPPVVLDQRFHRLGQADDGDHTVDLSPPSPEEAVGKQTQVRARVAAQVTRLVRGIPGTDHQIPVLVHAGRHRAELRGAVRPPRRQHRPVLGAHERPGLFEIHASILARRGTMKRPIADGGVMARLGRKAALTALWTALTASRRGGPTLGKRLAAVPRMIGAYIVSPIDVVPEGLLLAVGLIDDAAVAVWLAGAVLSETERFLEWERERTRVIPGSARPGPGGRRPQSPAG